MTKPQIESVDVYGRNAPKAARFGEGATSLDEIRQATDARRAQSTPASIEKVSTER